MIKLRIVILSLAVGFCSLADTQKVGRRYAESSQDAQVKKTGKEAAQEYFKADAARNSGSESKGISADDHYLAIHFSRMMQSEAWKWGTNEKQKDLKSQGFGVTYRFNEWGQTDLNTRFELNEYEVADQKVTKFSILPMIVFPEAGSKFPIYFGAAGGLGIFFKQIEQESSLSLDYQIFMGARFFNIIGGSGFFIEAGLKNHLLLLSDGQFNGTYLSLGALFTF